MYETLQRVLGREIFTYTPHDCVFFRRETVPTTVRLHLLLVVLCGQIQQLTRHTPRSAAHHRTTDTGTCTYMNTWVDIHEFGHTQVLQHSRSSTVNGLVCSAHPLVVLPCPMPCTSTEFVGCVAGSRRRLGVSECLHRVTWSNAVRVDTGDEPAHVRWQFHDVVNMRSQYLYKNVPFFVYSASRKNKTT